MRAIRVDEALLLYRVDEDRSGTGNGLADSGDHGDLIARERQGLLVSLRSDVSRIGDEAYKEYCARLDAAFQVPTALVEMIRSIRTSLDRFNGIESVALMYHAYLMTDAFLWRYRETFSTEFRLSDSQTPAWRVQFTPDVIVEWTRRLSRSANSYRMR